MIKYHAIICTEQMNLNGMCFTKEALENMAKQSETLPVTFEFRHDIPPLGIARVTSLTDEGLEVNITLNKPVFNFGGPWLFAVPGGIILERHQDQEITVIDRLKMTEVSLVKLPANIDAKSITPIEEIKDEKKK